MLVPLSVVLLRSLRARRIIATRTGHCQACGAHAPLAHLRFWKNTGMLVLRQTSSLAGDLCRGCAAREGGKMTLHTAVLGWWGTISFVLTLLILPANVLQVWWALGLRSAAGVARDALDAHREYALNLLATKDRDTVVDVLARTTGAAPGEVRQYLAQLT